MPLIDRNSTVTFFILSLDVNKYTKFKKKPVDELDRTALVDY